MKDDSRANLHDALKAAEGVLTFVRGKTFDDYTADELLRSGVERKFEIMGEALNRLRRNDPETLAAIRNHRDIISFRNILIHGYDVIDDRIVWGVLEDDLPALMEDIQRGLA